MQLRTQIVKPPFPEFIHSNSGANFVIHSATTTHPLDGYNFGSIMPGRNSNSGDYRYGYNNGSEKDDEITGVTGSHITTFFREYDLRLVRTWSIDPQSRMMPWQSPYVSMDNNPIFYNDPLGNTVEGTTEEDAGKAVEDVKSFLPESVVDEFFTIGEDGKTFNKIESTNALNKALRSSNATKEQKVLAHSLRKMINSKARFKVSYVEEGMSYFDPESASEGTAYISTESFMGPNRSVYTSTEGNPMSPTRAQLFVHELLGEGFYSAMGTKDLRTFDNLKNSFNSSAEMNNNPMVRENMLRIVQVENLYNSINQVFRSGLTHGVHEDDRNKVKDMPEGLTPYHSPGFYGGGNTVTK